MEKAGVFNVKKIVVLAFVSICLLLAMSWIQFSGSIAAGSTIRRDLEIYSSQYGNQTTHVGDLIIDGNETFIIKNCTYTQTGNIYVRDNATLILENAELFLNQSDYYQYSIHVYDAGSLLAKNIAVESNSSFGTYARGSAVLNLSDATTWRQPIYPSGLSRIIVFNSTTDMINPGDGCYLTINHSTISFLPVADGNPTIMIYNSYIEHGLGITANATIYVENSAIDSPELKFDNSTANLAKLRTGFFEYWNAHINETISENYNMTLVDTQVDGAWKISVVHDCEVVVNNSEIKVEVLSGSSSVRILNSGLNGIYAWEFQGILLFENTTVKNFAYLYLYGSNFKIDGNITFGLGTWISRWENVNLTRNYRIICQRKDGFLISNVSLALYHQYGTMVWNGTADSEGKADFNLIFSDMNYTDTLRLEATKGNLISESNVTLISDTPTVMNITELRIFNIVWETATYKVVLLSNSTVTSFNFSQPQKQISFNVTGSSGTIGYCNISISKDLLWDEFSVYKNGSLLEKDADYTQTFNDTHYSFYITYLHTTHTITIRATEVIPEFPTWTSILFMLIVLTISTAIYKRRLLKTPI